MSAAAPYLWVSVAEGPAGVTPLTPPPGRVWPSGHAAQAVAGVTDIGLLSLRSPDMDEGVGVTHRTQDSVLAAPGHGGSQTPLG